MIGIISGIGHDDLGGWSLDQCGGLRCIAFLTCSQHEPHGTSLAAKGHVYFGAQTPARAADRLIFRPLFSPRRRADAPRRSTIRYSKSEASDIASKIRHQTPFLVPRLKRRNRSNPQNASGRSRQGEPVRTIHSTPSTNIRLSRPVEPLWSGPMSAAPSAPAPRRSKPTGPSHLRLPPKKQL